MAEFILDLETIRKHAKEKLACGPVTEGYRADINTVIAILNDALATETICVLRYRQHYHTASGMLSESVAKEFLEHSLEEQAHADTLAGRITQLGGKPHLDPKVITERSHADYVECDTLDEMIRENLIAERIAIETYSEIIRYLGNDDPTTRRIIEEILVKEEEHADDLAKLLATCVAS